MDFKSLLTKLDTIGSKQNLNEGWKEMQADVEKRGEEEKKEQGTGKFDKKETSTGTVYTRKASTFDDGGEDKDTKKAKEKAKKAKVKEGEELVDEDDVEEGNEFSGARNAAIKAGKDEFEVDGKKYKVKESKKPDFLDLDNDGNKKEKMSDAAKDAEKVDESAAPGQEDWIKSNKERFVKQYGKKKGLEVLYATAWKRSKQKDESKKLEECYEQVMAQEDNSGMNINANMDTRTGQKSLTVTAQGLAADELSQILKLSGVLGGQSVVGDEAEVEMAEEYANEPAPVVQSADAQFHQGNDLNREKTMHRGSYRQGDNPMAMAEAAKLAAIEQRLMEELDKIKVK